MATISNFGNSFNTPINISIAAISAIGAPRPPLRKTFRSTINTAII